MIRIIMYLATSLLPLKLNQVFYKLSKITVNSRTINIYLSIFVLIKIIEIYKLVYEVLLKYFKLKNSIMSVKILSFPKKNVVF